MKIGVFLVDSYKPQEGGGFSYYDRLISAIDEYDFSSEIEVVFVGKTQLAGLKKKHLFLKSSIIAKVVRGIAFRLQKYFSVFKHLYNWVEKYYSLQDAKVLTKNNINVLFYPIQAYQPIKNFCFISTNWDLGHLSTYNFPEFIINGEYERREIWYQANLKKALLIFAESDTGKKQLNDLLNINLNRIKVAPLFAGNIINMHVSPAKQAEILDNLSLNQNDYLFYPAQFWAHKNHYNLLLAFRRVTTTQPNLKLVLTGSDKGNKSYIQNIIDKLNINNVLILGFVNDDTMISLYKNSLCLIMPSFLGPTNMPLLEAQHFGVPVVCSALEGHKEMLGSSALYFDPENQNEIHDAIMQIMDKDVRSRLVKQGEINLSTSKFKLDNAVVEIEKGFLKSKNIRSCWN